MFIWISFVALLLDSVVSLLPSPSLFGELFHNTTPINIIIQSFRLKFFDPLLIIWRAIE